MRRSLIIVLCRTGWVLSRHAHKSTQSPLSSPTEEYFSTFGPQIDLPFTGPLSFAHLPYTRCLNDRSTLFDIAVIGLPFDTAVSYRPGARFGPNGIRLGSRRLRPERGYSLPWESNPYDSNASKVIDCGDVPVIPFENKLAVAQMESAYNTLLNRQVATSCDQSPKSACMTATLAKDGKLHPRLVSLGGDHAIVLPVLRALHKIYGPVTVIHFDSHLDTWPLDGYYGGHDLSFLTHGTFFWSAAKEGLLQNGTSVHAGIRCKMTGVPDMQNDADVGFEILTTDDIDEIGTAGIVKLIRDRVGDQPVYLSLDIDVIDPSLAPATGTPEPGGWTPREVHRILRGLSGLNFVGVDIVEVAPAYDTNAESTTVIAANIVHELIEMMIHDKPPEGFRSALRRTIP